MHQVNQCINARIFIAEFGSPIGKELNVLLVAQRQRHTSDVQNVVKENSMLFIQFRCDTRNVSIVSTKAESISSHQDREQDQVPIIAITKFHSLKEHPKYEQYLDQHLVHHIVL